MNKQFDSVWEALEDTSEAAENMRMRSALMMAISTQLAQSNGTQSVKAGQLGIAQPRLNDLLAGKINKFSLDALVNIAVRAGLEVSIHTKAA